MAQTSKVGRHETSIYTENGITFIKYHSTNVVAFSADKIVLNTGGWLTNTTKARMNQASNQFNLGFYVYQKAKKWFVEHNGKVIEFAANLTLSR